LVEPDELPLLNKKIEKQKNRKIERDKNVKERRIFSNKKLLRNYFFHDCGTSGRKEEVFQNSFVIMFFTFSKNNW